MSVSPFVQSLERRLYVLGMETITSIPSNDSRVRAAPYPSQGNTEPFLFQENYGRLVRKKLTKNSQAYIKEEETSQETSQNLRSRTDSRKRMITHSTLIKLWIRQRSGIKFEIFRNNPDRHAILEPLHWDSSMSLVNGHSYTGSNSAIFIFASVPTRVNSYMKQFALRCKLFYARVDLQRVWIRVVL